MNSNRMIQITSNAIALTLFAAAIGCGRGQNPQAQLALLAGALPISLVGSYHGHLADKADPYQRMRDAASLEAYAGQLAAAIEIPVMPASMSMPAPMLPAASAPMGEGEAIATTPLESVLSTGTGIALLGNSGSGKSSIVQWLIGEAQPESLVILDPHNDGKTWGDLPVVDDYDAILDKLADLLEELKLRRDRRKKGLPNPPLMIVADEWASLRAYASKRKNDVCDEFVLLMGCEARKLNMVTLLCSHSGNVKAMGLDGQGDFLENWCLVRLGKIAKKYARNMSDRVIAEAVAKAAYPCLINDELSYHPTHGHYQEFRDNQHPQNIKPYRKSHSLNAIHNQDENNHVTITNSQESEAVIIRKYIDRLYKMPGYNHPEPSAEKTTSTPTDAPAAPNNSQPAPIDMPESQPLSAPVQKGYSEVAREGYPAAILPAPALAPMVESLKSEGINQAQIIKILWGISKGGNETYKRCVDEFKALIK